MRSSRNGCGSASTATSSHRRDLARSNPLTTARGSQTHSASTSSRTATHQSTLPCSNRGDIRRHVCATLPPRAIGTAAKALWSGEETNDHGRAQLSFPLVRPRIRLRLRSASHCRNDTVDYGTKNVCSQNVAMQRVRTKRKKQKPLADQGFLLVTPTGFEPVLPP
jgi:hypothetical protein